MTDTDRVIQNLIESHPLREPVLRAAIEALPLPLNSRGLDAGCGIGLQTAWLAEMIGDAGHVTGLDISPDLLHYAEQTVNKQNGSKRIAFLAGDVRKLPFDDGMFDWVWSADCVGYPVGDSTAALEELVRVTKPGGMLALLGWSSQQLLPGYPLLEARLNAFCSAYAPYYAASAPESFFLRGLRRLHALGLEQVSAKTFVGDIQAPLSGEIRHALISLFQMLWVASPQTAPDDWAEYRRLCQPESPDFILDVPDYYAFFTYTLLQGRKPRH